MRTPAAPFDEKTLAILREACGGEALAGAVVLGSGLGVLLEHWQSETILKGTEIPGYPRSTVAGHAGQVAVVRWNGRPGLVFQGRVHLYEGYTRAEITFAVRLAAELGATWMLFTNAAGSVNPSFPPGTVMVVEDHLKLFLGAYAAGIPGPGRSLRGSPYHPGRTRDLLRMLSGRELAVVRGTLMGGLGPTYETCAEVEMTRRMGGDAACMSTVVEAEEGVRLGLEVAALSLITNLATGLSAEPLAHAEVVAMAAARGPELAAGIAAVVNAWTAS